FLKIRKAFWHRHPTITKLDNAAHCPWRMPANPHWERLLNRFGFTLDPAELHKLTGKLWIRVRPQLFHRSQVVIAKRTPFLKRRPEQGNFFFHPANTGAKHHASAREDIQRREH